MFHHHVLLDNKTQCKEAEKESKIDNKNERKKKSKKERGKK
jgi:hypothetical protein